MSTDAQPRHLLAFTVDTDPDGLSAPGVNRNAASYASLDTLLEAFPQIQEALGETLPVSWFLRIDGQIAQQMGHPLALYREFKSRLQALAAQGHCLEWHPHLYDLEAAVNGSLPLLTDPARLVPELRSLWAMIRAEGLEPMLFRNGEGWLTAEMLGTLAEFGLKADSTAIPGMSKRPAHPLHWPKTPQHPYWPEPSAPDTPAVAPGTVLEVPMRTWMLQASYDAQPKRRYLNPGVKPEYFQAALRQLSAEPLQPGKPTIWVMIAHPDDLVPNLGPDLLYARDPLATAQNLRALAAYLRTGGADVMFCTLRDAVNQWLAAS